MSNFITEMTPLNGIRFLTREFTNDYCRELLPIDELESLGVFDPNRYKKK